MVLVGFYQLNSVQETSCTEGNSVVDAGGLISSCTFVTDAPLQCQRGTYGAL